MSKECLESFDTVLKTLDNVNYPKYRELKANIEKLRESTVNVAKFVHQYDYKNLKFNGYRSYLKIIERLVKIIEDTFRCGPGNAEDLNRLIIVSRCFVTYLEHINDLRYLLVLQEKGEIPIRAGRNKRTLSLTPPPMYQTVEFYHTYRSESQELSTLFGYYNCFWLCPSARRVWDTFSLIMALFYQFPVSLRSLWDKEAKGHYIMKTLRNSTVSYPFNACWGLSEVWPYKKLFIPLYHWNTLCKVATVYIPSQNTWIIPDNGGRVDYCLDPPVSTENKNSTKAFTTNTGSKKIRCRLLKHKYRSSRTKIVLHAHGGAFIVQSPDSHEIYLRTWTANLHGIPIISVDYTLQVKYPRPLQELLDVYLWLTSGDPLVEKMIGFHPTEIILSGDSCGGLLTMGLALILQDIRGTKQGCNIVYPKGYVGVYMGFTSTSISPSKLMGKIDPIVNVGPLLTSLGIYAEGIEFDHQCNELDSNDYEINKGILGGSLRAGKNTVAETLRSIERFLFPWTKKPWHSCDRHKFENRARKIFSKVDNAYSQPIDFGDLGAISDMPIYLICGEFDLLLDDNIDLAKKWKGPVKLDVVKGIGHGFLNWILMSKDCQDASKLCLKRLQQSLGFD